MNEPHRPIDDHASTDGEVAPRASFASADFAEKNRKSSKYLIGIILFGFFLAAISIPLYRLVCAKFDPGGSSWYNGDSDTYEGVVVDESRTVRVRFTANVNSQLPWQFHPTEPSVEVHPGEKRLTNFFAKNLDHAGSINGKGVYDINPPEAGQYFKKIECFCFREQTLEAGQQRDMPLYFWFDPELPAHIKEITVAYTFFNVDSSLKRTMERREKASAQ